MQGRHGRRWAVAWALSVALHGALIVVVLLMPARAHRTPLRAIEVVERKLPEPEHRPKPLPKLPELGPEPAEPRVAMMKRVPRVKPPPAEEKREPEPKVEEPRQKEETGPKTFGLKLEGTTRAPAGTGVQLPRGESVRVSPTVTKKGPSRKVERPSGFKASYGKGEEAPVAVVTTQPKVLRQVTAEYPEKMKELGIEGRVILELTVDENGRVARARVLTSLRAELDAVALVAARQLLFSPARVNGVPVKVKIPYTFTFVLD